MKYKTLDTKRQFIAGKFIVCIDPGKERHQAAVLNPFGVQLAIFTFNALELPITYCKLRCNLLQQRARCRAALSYVFADGSKELRNGSKPWPKSA